MRRRVRVLVVDDAVAIRATVSDTLSEDPDIEVVGTAPNGRIALAKLERLSPDVVILDIEMPELDGLQTLLEIRRTYPKLPVIMFSSYTERGAAATLDALSLGATDYVTKPSVTDAARGMGAVRDELVRKVKGVAAEVLAPPPGRKEPFPTATRGAGVTGRRRQGNPWLVAIGASTGGPNALTTILAALPADFPAPVVVVQHMPPLFTRLLARRLDAACALKVREAVDGAIVAPGDVWVARGDWHMEVARRETTVHLSTHRQPPQHSCRPAVDVLLRSAAESYGRYALAVVLTGMGRDGLRGCEEIRARGGDVFVQDEASSVVWSMPGCVAVAGLAGRVVPVEDMASEIVRHVVGDDEPTLVRRGA